MHACRHCRQAPSASVRWAGTFTTPCAADVTTRTFGGFVVTVLVHTDMASPHLHHAGSAGQKARWMPGVTAGRTITAVAITEPDAGSNSHHLSTTATRDGDVYRISGQKIFASMANETDVGVLFAKTDRKIEGMRPYLDAQAATGQAGFEFGGSGDGPRGVARSTGQYWLSSQSKARCSTVRSRTAPLRMLVNSRAHELTSRTASSW